MSSLIKRILVLILLLGIASLIIYETRFVTHGPRIDIQSPVDGSSFTEPLITLTGTVSNVATMTINGNRALPRTDGDFSYPLALPEGYSLVTIRAQDRFGKETTLSLKYWYQVI